MPTYHVYRVDGFNVIFTLLLGVFVFFHGCAVLAEPKLLPKNVLARMKDGMLRRYAVVYGWLCIFMSLFYVPWLVVFRSRLTAALSKPTYSAILLAVNVLYAAALIILDHKCLEKRKSRKK